MSPTLEYSGDGGITFNTTLSGGYASFPNSISSFVIRVKTLADSVVEPDETYSLYIDPVAGVSPGRGMGLGVIVDGAIAPTPVPVGVVAKENAKTIADGVTDQWIISTQNLATNHQIEGYASATSITRGETISFHINTSDPTYALAVYRMGWYGGAGGRLVQAANNLPGQQQPACPITDSATNLRECNWAVSYSLNVPNNSVDPTDWASGVYLVKLTGSSGKQSYIIFTLRDDNRNADFLFQSAVTTYAAYNIWGGSNVYGTGGTPIAYKVSFNRPYAHNAVSLNPAIGAGDFMEWELLMVRFLERNGYDVAYSTNIDTHTSGARLLAHKAFLSVGHDEYWTKQMRDNVEAARDAGVNLGFFGANNAYWQIRLEPSSTNQPNRTIVAYRSASVTNDPMYAVNPAESTLHFRDPEINRPEAGLIGMQYIYNSINSDMVVADCTSWVCSGTGLLAGDSLPGLMGYEVDAIGASSPGNTVAVMSSPFVCQNSFAGCENSPTWYTNMGYYTAPSGATVFSTGSMNWNFGLDGFGPRAQFVSGVAQQITMNVLNRFLGISSPAPTLYSAESSASASTLGHATPAAGGGCAFQSGGNPPRLDISLLLLVAANLVWRIRRRHSTTSRTSL
ncbi:MAG: N,N-dimethylformamidase beta subunit family domain-containing protein [Burkholderiales bacterium]